MRRYLELLFSRSARSPRLRAHRRTGGREGPRRGTGIHLGWPANVSHPFYAEGTAAWKAAAKSLGVKATFVGPENPDVQQQIALIEAAIAKPTTAGILIYSVNDGPPQPVLMKARAAGIPVIAGNGEIKDHLLAILFVGTANSSLGAIALRISSAQP